MKPTAKPTPGPWRVEQPKRKKEKRLGEVVEVLPQFDYLYVMTGAGEQSIDCLKSGESREQSEVNARLIAAAPELIDALKKIEQWAYEIGQGERADDLEKSRVIMMQARLALSKALVG